MLNEIEVNRFFKVVQKMSSDLDISGVKVKLTDNKQVLTVRGVDIEVPLFRIYNPKNIPFSYNSLKDLLLTELITANKFAGTDLPYQIIDRLINFDDFYAHDFYIPPHIEKRLISCLNHHEAKIKHRTNNDIIYTIYCEYIVDSNFDMYWDSSEEFRTTISIKLKEIFVDNLGRGDFYTITDKDEMEKILYRVTEQEPFTFEDPVWHCFSDNLTEYVTFIDTQWQFINISVIPI